MAAPLPWSASAMTFFRYVVTLLVLTIAVSAGTATAQRSAGSASAHAVAPVDSVLQGAIAAGAKRARVIIRVDPDRRRALKEELKRQRYEVKREHPLISAITVDIPLNAVDHLARRPGVRSISSDALVGVVVDETAADVGTTGTLLRETLGLRHSSLTGAGVGVAVIDSGIQRSPDLRPKAFYDFTQGGIARAPYDDHGHGTHVAGLIGGSGALSDGLYSGVAPKVSLVGLKVLTATGSGYTSDVISALEFVTLWKAALGIDVINLSLGHPPFESATTDPLVQAVDAASTAGILVVVSAGNVGINPATGRPGYGGILSPANARSALTVGSGHTQGTVRRTDDLVGPYSSRGPTRNDNYVKPDVIAPGHRLIAPAAAGSTLVVDHPSWLVPSTSGALSYLRLTGTSMAAAVTSGVAALLIQANRALLSATAPRPPLTPNAIKAIIQFTALTMRDEAHVIYNPLVQGAGAINAAGATALAAAIDTATPQGQPWLALAVQPYTDIDEVLPWVQIVLWGDFVLWGDAVYWNSPAWAPNVRWGDNAFWHDTVLWGDRIVWGDILIWGDDIVWGDILIWGDNLHDEDHLEYEADGSTELELIER